MRAVKLGGLLGGTSFGMLEPQAFAFGLDDVATVRESIERSSGKSLIAEDFGPMKDSFPGFARLDSLTYSGTVLGDNAS